MNNTDLPTEPDPQNATENITDLANRAQSGDKAALQQLRDLLKDPISVKLYGGELAFAVEQTLIGKFCGKNLLFKESIRAKLELLRDELAGPNPPALERLLVERVVTCWLHLHYLEGSRAVQNNMSLELAMHYEHCIDRAQKRHLSAIKMLALVRKLALPVLAQVNIAGGHVNMATVNAHGNRISEGLNGQHEGNGQVAALTVEGNTDV